jgi:predicted aminopeptidase
MSGKVKRIIKRILVAILTLILILVIIYWDLVVYGIRQAKGQLNIIYNAKPVENFLTDPNFPDSLKNKLLLINNVRKYAIDSLGLRDTKNYKTLYDQKGEEIMWVVTACEPFRLKAKEWKFPVLGWDVSIRNPGGWSTLGWFTDPILSKMLERSEGDLANLIIHEMVHSTIFVKDSIDFNENLATFIGDRGAEKFLISKYGVESKEYKSYLYEDEDYLKFADHMLRSAEKLDSLYKTMTEADPIEKKNQQKKEMIEKIVAALDTLKLQSDQRPSQRYQKVLPNNAFFMNFRRYQSKQYEFWEQYRSDFHEDLKSYISFMSAKYPFL